MTRLVTTPVRTSHSSTLPAILGIGTANPPAAPQTLALELALELGHFNDSQKAWMKRLYLRSGIETRCSVLAQAPSPQTPALRYAEEPGRTATEPALGITSAPASIDPDQILKLTREFYPPATGPDDKGPTTAVRMARYAVEAPKLAIASAQSAIEQAELAPDEITHLITASCTGFFAPGLDSALIEQLGLPRTVQRIHVGFMGCHAAFNALAAARNAAGSHPGARVLVTSVELCTLHHAYGTDPGKLVANSLFADGSASVVVGQGGEESTGLQLSDFSSCLLTQSSDAMTWNIGDHGFEMTLSPGVPEIIRSQLAPWCVDWLAKNDLELTDIKGWAVHPGGPKILSAVAEALSLAPDALRFSRDILARFGNMSSATVLFILRQMAAEIDGPIVAIGLGPGLMAEGMLVNR
jgi:predicted naringenin-chalcone synthase